MNYYQFIGALDNYREMKETMLDFTLELTIEMLQSKLEEMCEGNEITYGEKIKLNSRVRRYLKKEGK